MKNALYAQSGGVTAVINSSAAGVLHTFLKKSPGSKMYMGLNGIVGVLKEEMVCFEQASVSLINTLAFTPGGAFGSCRYKLKDLETQAQQFERILEVFAAHDIGYFFYNGGNDSQDTANKIAMFAKQRNFDLKVIGIPKTIDNDLMGTDFCPGFLSSAKFLSRTLAEVSMDVKAMRASSTKIFILETMGRNAGWLAGSTIWASTLSPNTPNLQLLPEVAFDQNQFLQLVQETVKTLGYCTIAVSEGLKDADGNLLYTSDSTDAFGHKQLGGVAQGLAQLTQTETGFKTRYALPDYLQRSCAHIGMLVDTRSAFLVGAQAVELALAGESEIMVTLKTHNGSIITSSTALSTAANSEKQVPESWIDKEKLLVTEKFTAYLEELFNATVLTDFALQQPAEYYHLDKKLVEKKLASFSD